MRKLFYGILAVLCGLYALRIMSEQPIHEIDELRARFAVFCRLGFMSLGFVGCALEERHK